MNVTKFESSAVVGNLRHVSRLIKRDKNKDIDRSRTALNYSLTPYIEVSREEYQHEEGKKAVYERERAYYKKRKDELYCYNRKDVKTLAGCVVTLPKEITDATRAKEFFLAVSQFLSERYGGEATDDGREHPNVISITVHYDEKEIGQPHLHFLWIPTVKIDHDALQKRKHHPKEMDNFREKISAKEVLTKADLRTLHQDLQEYLNRKGIEGKVIKKEGGASKSINLTVAQLKELTDRTGEVFDRDNLSIDKLATLITEHRELRNKVKELEKIDASKEVKKDVWGRTIEERSERTWDIEW